MPSPETLSRRPRAPQTHTPATTAWWTLPVAVAVLVRVTVQLLSTPHGYDPKVFTEWAAALTSGPLSDFYARVPSADHLPGDLLLHALLGHVGPLVGLDPAASQHYVDLLQGTAILFDVLLLVLVGRLVRGQAPSEQSVRAARWAVWAVAVVPAFPAVSAWWGQLDNLSSVLLLSAVVAYRRRSGPGDLAGTALLAWAVLVKPQMALVAAPVFIWGVCARATSPRERTARAMGLAVVGAVSAQLVCAPFNVGLVPGVGRWNLHDRVAVASQTFHMLTLGAPNVWSWWPQPWQDERVALVLGMPAGQLAKVLVAGTGLALVALGGRRRFWASLAGALWLGASLTVSWYLLDTRIHERYLYPALVVLIVVAGLTRDRLVVWAAALAAAALSVAVLVGLDPPASATVHTWLMRAASGLVVGALALLVARARLSTLDSATDAAHSAG